MTVQERLQELKVEKARNLLRRYLETNAEEQEALKRLRNVLKAEGKAYCCRCSGREAVKIYMAAYCPWRLYRKLYGSCK